MHKNSPQDGGYKLVINYNSRSKVYTIAGYTWTLDKNNVIHSDLDGEFLVFDSLEDVIKSIVDYPS